MIEQAVEPEKLTRLATLQEQQLQYRLVHSAEAAKIELSKTADLNVPLDYLESTLTIPVNRRALGDASARLVDKVRELALEAVTAAGAQPDVVFLTGGMAISPIVSDAVADVVGKNVRLQSSDMLGTVGKGLGLCAQRVFRG